MAKLLQFLAFLSFPLLILCQGWDGMDVSMAVSEHQFYCLRVNYGKMFAIVRVWRSNGVVDENGAENLKNAGRVGMILMVDGYIFPCFKCQDPKGQIRTLLQYLWDKGATYVTLWLDIEDPAMWSSNPTENVAFIQEMVDELKAHSKIIGIYTSLSQWSAIMGGSPQFNEFDLWYAHYDGNRNFTCYLSN